MTLPRSVIEQVAALGHVVVQDTFFRHAAPGRDAFIGGSNGRWGATFPVIYLGQPESGVIIEAYRHLVEDAGVPAKSVRSRVLYTVPMQVTRILDLTTAGACDSVGLTAADIASDVGDYAACQQIAAAAHHLRLHGILAPAAHEQGRTLALFRDWLPLTEIPTPSNQVIWDRLPTDPRSL